METVEDEILLGIKKRNLVTNGETSCSISKIAAQQAIEAAGISQNDIDMVILAIEHQGNTSTASISLALDYSIRKGKIQGGDLLFMDAFGAGLAWGGALMTY